MAAEICLTEHWFCCTLNAFVEYTGSQQTLRNARQFETYETQRWPFKSISTIDDNLHEWKNTK